MIKDNQIIKKVKEVAWKIIDDETVILNPKTVTFYKLNKTATFIWKSINSKRKKYEIINLITNEFKVDKSKAQKDLTEFMTSLHKKGLIKLI